MFYLVERQPYGTRAQRVQQPVATGELLGLSHPEVHDIATFHGKAMG
jgi:hypothetical protein